MLRHQATIFNLKFMHLLECQYENLWCFLIMKSKYIATGPRNRSGFVVTKFFAHIVILNTQQTYHTSYLLLVPSFLQDIKKVFRKKWWASLALVHKKRKTLKNFSFYTYVRTLTLTVVTKVKGDFQLFSNLLLLSQKIGIGARICTGQASETYVKPFWK